MLRNRRLTDAVRALAEAALSGDTALKALLEGGRSATSASVISKGGPLGPVWLERLQVSGFQGIGGTVEVRFNPQPGLTLLIGRNGAGKSSLAEALQIAITGTSSRWEGKTKTWKDGWRNLHAAGEPSVETDFLIEGSTHRLRVRATWPGTSPTPRIVIHRGPDVIPEAALAWSEALDVHRPFLAYTELGALLGGKSTVAHDALMRGLNLSELDGAIKSLRTEASSRSRLWTATLDRAKDLIEDLKRYDNPRVARVLGALRAEPPQLDVIAEILSGSDPQSTDGIDALRAAATARPVDLSIIERAASELTRAAEARDRVAGTEAGRDLGVADLLARAVAFHADHGDGACPVCGEGRLDTDWYESASREERELRARANAATSAERALAAARRTLDESIPRATPSLSGLSTLGMEVEGPLRALTSLISCRDIKDDRERATAAIERARVVDIAFGSIRAEAEKAIRSQEDVWRELHPRIVAFHHDARVAERSREWHALLKTAQKTLEGILDELRAERWAPIAGEVVELWKLLRINSNVGIDTPQLAGTASNRRIEYGLNVDGTDNAALGVMSQGELTALALALFIPRATLPDSPFKFLILDDPVQSMDMSRVDGLARVLRRISEHRQVIVLTHDERLREALLRQQIPATIHRVSRAPNSVVNVRKVSTPWEMHLADANALSADNIAPELARVSVPVLGRLAIESKCVHLIRGMLVDQGRAHDEADEIIERLPRLTEKVAYARLGEANRTRDLYTELNRALGGWAVDTLKACSEGSHGDFNGDAQALAKNVGRLLRELS